MVEGRHWGVLGGGVLGLTLALRLAEQGEKVSVIEAGPHPGGLVTPWQIGDVTWDRFYHVIVSSDAQLLAVLRQIGVHDEVEWRRTRTLFYAGDDLYPLNDVFDYLRLPELRLLDKLRLAFNIIYGSRIARGHTLEDLSAAEWLTRYSGRRAYERLWRPLLRAKLGSNEPHASAAFIWGVMRRFYGAREGRTKTEMFGYVRGGYARVIEAWCDHLRGLGVEFVCDAPVQGVDADSTGVTVRLPGLERRFDRCVMTFAAPIVARVCTDLAPDRRERLQAILYQGVVCVSLLLRRPLGGAYLTYITDESIPFTTVIEMSTLVERSELGGHHLVYLPKYVPAGDPFLQRPDDTVIAEFVAGLQRIYPDLVASDIVTARVARTPFVAPVMTRGYSALLPPVDTGLDNLYLVSSAQLVHGSSSVNETIRLADAALPRLLPEESA